MFKGARGVMHFMVGGLIWFVLPAIIIVFWKLRVIAAVLTTLLLISIGVWLGKVLLEIIVLATLVLLFRMLILWIDSGIRRETA
jgi:hypothetical protein